MTLIYLVAGEQSGDVLGARLMTALHAARPELEFAGVGGPQMTAAGLRSLFPMRELAVMGFAEVLPRLFRLRRRMHEAASDIIARAPDVLVTVDSPSFSFRLLRLVAKLGRPKGMQRVHYVAPQVWAWRESRVRKYPGLWDRLLCLLPFEPAFFARHGLAALFVGHPVLESGADRGDGARFRAQHGIAPNAKVLLLMPGSRRSETSRLLPVFARTLKLLARDCPGLVPVLPVASVVADTVAHAVADWTPRPIVVGDIAGKHDAYAAASAALTKSGTSTLEMALAGVPMAVTYRVNPLTYQTVRRLIRVPFVAMVNLLAGRALVPELLQHDSNPERIAAVLLELLRDGPAAAAQRAGFAAVLVRLSPPTGLPSEAAAAAVLELLPAGG